MIATSDILTPNQPRGTSRRSAAVLELSVPSRPFELLADEIGEPAWSRLARAREQARAALGRRTVWSVNSTATGGGVAEMQRTLLPYWRGSGLDVRWLVLVASPRFFRLTKELHNMLHGDLPERRLGLRAVDLYEAISRTAAVAALGEIAAGDVVILHDPQTAGLAPILKRAGAVVIWRCHVGADTVTPPVEEAWRFLMPYLSAADVCVFTRREFVPAGLEPDRVRVSAPAIDPRSPKNQSLGPELAEAILDQCGLARRRDGRKPSVSAATVSRAWGVKLLVDRRCRVLRHDRPAQLGRDRIVVSLSRWDRLKDQIGILHACAEHVRTPGVRLILAGPATCTVADDPEDAGVLRAVRAAWVGAAPEPVSGPRIAKAGFRSSQHDRQAAWATGVVDQREA